MNVYDLLVKHEEGKNKLNELVLKKNSWLGRDSSIYDTITHQKEKVEEIEERFKCMKIYKYEVSFGCVDGRQGLYLADTIKELHRKIDDDSILQGSEKDILKHGYFNEFKGKEMETQDYTIDNAIHFMWRLNY